MPRVFEDQQFHQTLESTQGSVIKEGSIDLHIEFGGSINWQKVELELRPPESMSYDWRQATKYGLSRSKRYSVSLMRVATSSNCA
jgi:hypothetical protein